MLDAALLYAELGWHVIPLWGWDAERGRCACGNAACGPAAKHPHKLAPNGLKNATTDAAQIRAWWSEAPTANIGIVTGEISGLVVLDSDPKNGGTQSFMELAKRTGPLMMSLNVKTGSGGRHVYFRHPGFDVRNTAGALGAGLDTRGDGGYVVAPPSIHASGNAYVWDDGWHPEKRGLAGLAPMPAVLATSNAPARTESGVAREVGARIPKGTQHHTLVSLAGSMRRRGLSAAEIFPSLWAIAQRCEDVPLEANVRRIADDMARYAPEEALGYAAEAAEERAEASPFTPLSDVMRRVLLEAERVHGTGGITGVTTGLRSLDLMTGGFQKADLVVLGARPSMGKSSLAFSIAQAAARSFVREDEGSQHARGAFVFSLEMAEMAFGQRLLSSGSGVDTMRLRTGTMTDADWKDATNAAGRLAALPIYVCDRTGLRASQARHFLEHHADVEGVRPGIVFVDYLQMMRGESADGRSFNREDEAIASVSLALKGLARQFDCPVVALAQLNRDCEKRPDKRPQLTDLRASGQIEQDADVALLLHRPERYGFTHEEVDGVPRDMAGIAQLLVPKQRNGPVGELWLRMDAATARFEDHSWLRSPVPNGRTYAHADAF